MDAMLGDLWAEWESVRENWKGGENGIKVGTANRTRTVERDLWPKPSFRPMRTLSARF
jgi:hypothetical protein